jgi:hypothetical protein
MLLARLERLPDTSRKPFALLDRLAYAAVRAWSTAGSCGPVPVVVEVWVEAATGVVLR